MAATKPKADAQQITIAMRFTLPGQLRGPECRSVMKQAITLRKKLEPWFALLNGGDIVELGVALRIDGSLGTFGPEGVENVVVDGGKIQCDVVVADQGWSDLSDEAIMTLLRHRVLDAVHACLEVGGVTYDAESLASAAL